MFANRVVGAVAVVLAAFAVTATSAWAHSDLDQTRPAMDAVLETPPDAIELIFNIEVADRGMRLNVRDTEGNVVPVERPVRLDATTVRAAVQGPVPAGALRVRWSVIAADGHRVSGAYGFRVERGTPPAAVVEQAEATGGAAVPPPAEVPDVEPSEVAEIAATGLRAVGYAALLLLIGAVLIRLAVVPFTARVVADRDAVRGLEVTVRSVVAIALVALVVVSLAAIPAQARADALTVGEILAIRTGQVALLTAALGVAALVAFTVLARHARSRAALFVAAALVAALSVTPVLTGHSATASVPVAAVDWVHVLAAGAWGGGVLTLALFAARFLRRVAATDRPQVVGATIHAFTRVALVGLGLLVVSGAVTAVVMVGSPLNLLDSTWGLVLLAKIGTVILAVLLAGLARRGTSFEVGVRLEAGVILAAIVLTGVLTGLNP